MHRLAVLGLCLLPATLLAQSPAQRDEIEVFRDSVTAVNDSVGLLASERALIGHASHELRDSAMVHIRLGFLALRLGDLSGHKHYEDAASEFQWVVDLKPKWPYGWFGLGLAELGVGDAEFSFLRGLQTALGKDALTRSANDFARSAEADPSFVRGLVELSNTALRQRINLRLDVALAALRRAAHTPAGSNPEVLLVRARVEREVGSADSALVAADSLVARTPASAVALHELARARFHAGRLDGNEPWFRGLLLADGPALASYRADLQFILPDSTMHAFDAANAVSRLGLIRAFWEVRDRDELHGPGERLREHYRRLDVARRDYRLATVRRHYDIVERYRPPVLDFDDRGVIYIRHGEPDQRATVALPGIPANESWLYHRPDAPDLLFHFVARESVTDFRLVASALDILDFARTVRLQGTGDLHGTEVPVVTHPGPISRDSAAMLRQRASDLAASRVAETIIRSRLDFGPVYQRMLIAGKAGAVEAEADERALGMRSIRIGTTTDSWLPHYAKALPADVELLAVGGDLTRPELQIAWAIPVTTALKSDSTSETLAPRMKVSVIDSLDLPRPMLDSVVSSIRVGAPGHTYYMGIVPLGSPPGRVTVRVSLEADSAGVISNRDTVEIPVPGGPPTLSDLALGVRGASAAAVTAAGDTLWVDPAAEFRASQSMQLYFETANLAAGSQYRLELSLRASEQHSVLHWIAGLFGKGDTRYRVSFTRRTSGPVDRVHHELPLVNLQPGKYVLEVAISPPSGEKRIRRQTFIIIP